MVAPFIFISHSSEDLAFAQKIAQDLIHQGYEIWLDDMSIVGSIPYWDEIQNAIHQCTVFLYLISPRSISPGNGARKELFHADSLKKKPLIVPIKIRDVDFSQIPIVVSPGEYQIHDFVGRGYDEAFRRTLNAIAKGFENVNPKQDATAELEAVPAANRSIFISYRFDAPDDRQLAEYFAAELRRRSCVVFISDLAQTLQPRSELEATLRGCSVMLSILSSASVVSQAVVDHIALAQSLRGAENIPLQIMPVRFLYHNDFPHYLESLHQLPWLKWESTADTEVIFEAVDLALNGKSWGVRKLTEKSRFISQTSREVASIPVPEPYADPGSARVFLEQPTGTVNTDSRFYIERRGDTLVAQHLKQEYTTLVVKAARQMGKSSLLKRAKRMIESSDGTAAIVDFQSLVDKRVLDDDTLFFQRLCSMIARALRIQKSIPSPEETWEPMYGNAICCTDYMEQHVFPALGDRRIFLAIDEADRVLSSDFRSDFFSMLRVWHNQRADNPDWMRLSMALVISTEPRVLIEDVNQSPFNVGITINLDDFTPEQVIDLNERHDRPFSAQALAELYDWIGGHPFLNRYAMYLVANGSYSVQAFFDVLTTSDSPFMDHLTHYMGYFHERPSLAEAMLNIIQQNSMPGRDSLLRLQSAGLIRQQGSRIEPRCRLYSEFYSTYLQAF